jgi:hypothetical protein
MHTKDRDSELCIVVSISLNQSVGNVGFVKILKGLNGLLICTRVRQLSGA